MLIGGALVATTDAPDIAGSCSNADWLLAYPTKSVPAALIIRVGVLDGVAAAVLLDLEAVNEAVVIAVSVACVPHVAEVMIVTRIGVGTGSFFPG